MNMDPLLIEETSPQTVAGRTSDERAARLVFTFYREGRAPNTLRRQDADLKLFARFLATVGDVPGELSSDPDAWSEITHQLVSSFVRWQLLQGYAVSSIGVRLSTVKIYAKLARQAGTMEATTHAMIRTVQGYSSADAERLDEAREAAEIPTRKGLKKSQPVALVPLQAEALKNQPNTPQGRRDALIMTFLLDHGLRVGELSSLDVTDIDLRAGELRYYVPRLSRYQTHVLTTDALRAALSYLHHDAPAMGPLLRASRKDGRLHGVGMSTRAVTARVRVLGQVVGVAGLSAHDCRHYWATQAALNRTPLDQLQAAGGWTSPATPLRYVEAARLAREAGS